MTTPVIHASIEDVNALKVDVEALALNLTHANNRITAVNQYAQKDIENLNSVIDIMNELTVMVVSLEKRLTLLESKK